MGGKDGWKLAWRNKRAEAGFVFSIKEACKGAGGEDRESEISPQHPIFRTEVIKIYGMENQPSLARRFEIGPECQDFLGRSDAPGDAIALDASKFLTYSQAQQSKFDELLAGEAMEGFLIHAL